MKNLSRLFGIVIFVMALVSVLYATTMMHHYVTLDDESLVMRTEDAALNIVSIGNMICALVLIRTTRKNPK